MLVSLKKGCFSLWEVLRIRRPMLDVNYVPYIYNKSLNSFNSRFTGSVNLMNFKLRNEMINFNYFAS